MKLGEELLTFVDVAAVLNQDGNIYLSLVNRSAGATQSVDVVVPKGLQAAQQWRLVHNNINEGNTPGNRSAIVPVSSAIKSKKNKITASILPCGLVIMTFSPKK